MATVTEPIYGHQYLNYQTNRSWLRKTIRKAYLWQVRRHVIGDAIDFGCGCGEHLATLSKGSLGLEVNETAVSYCQQRGLNVQHHNSEDDDFSLSNIPANRYQTLVISHVLEHLPNPYEVLAKLMAACQRKGIGRILVVVPQEAGFAHDATHQTFVTQPELAKVDAGFKLIKWGYFPFNLKIVGKFFTYNELFCLWESGK